MANYISTRDLKLGALDKSGEVQSGTSDYDSVVLKEINQLYRSVIAGSNEFHIDLGDPWEWAKADEPGVLTITPPFETGSVSLTVDSNAGTFSDAPTGLGSLKDHFFRVDNRDTVYRIATHTANATAFTLDQIYLETTGTALAFKVIKLEYDLVPNIERLCAPMTVFRQQIDEDDDGKISQLTLAALQREFPLKKLRARVPTRYAIRYERDGQIVIRFNTFFTEKMRVEYNYIPIQAELKVLSFLDADVTTGTDRITIASHGFPTDHAIQLVNTNGGTLPAGLTADTTFYVLSPTTNDFQLAVLPETTTPIDITAAAGTGTHNISSIPVIPIAFRKILLYGPTHAVLVDKSDSRADFYLRQTQAVMQAMITDHRKQQRVTGKNIGRLIPRRDHGIANRPRVFGFER